MANNRITKEALANTLRDLLTKYPLSKISVKNIADHCNISRNTFYYHFKDKYELINWIFYTDMLKNVNSFTDPKKLLESFSSVCKYLYTNRKFYMACFQYVGQNCLYDYLVDFYYELWKVNISVLYSECGFKLTSDELHLMARMEAHSLVGIITDWVKGGMHNNYINYFDQLYAVHELETSAYARLSEQRMLDAAVPDTNKDNKLKEKGAKVC